MAWSQTKDKEVVCWDNTGDSRMEGQGRREKKQHLVWQVWDLEVRGVVGKEANARSSNAFCALEDLGMW